MGTIHEDSAKVPMHINLIRFNSLLTRFFRRYLWLLGSRKQSEKSKKLLLRSVLAVLDGFHFSVDDATELPVDVGAADEVANNESMEIDEAEEVLSEHDGDDEEETMVVDSAEDHAVSSEDVITTITQTILPKLYNNLTEKSESTKKKGVALVVLRPQVALAIVKVLLNLPKSTMDSKVPQLFTRIAGVLKDRIESSRDGARICLGEIAKMLGPDYFGDIVRELTASLTRGFQLHVLGYVDLPPFPAEKKIISNPEFLEGIPCITVCSVLRTNVKLALWMM